MAEPVVERWPFEAPPPERDGPPPVVAVIPAAGSGSRLGGELPKQYLMLGERTLLEHAVDAMFAVPRVTAAVIALADGDDRYAALPLADDPRIVSVTGGETRADSVARALVEVRHRHGDDAWALVHDAARPLVSREDVERLIDAVQAAVPDETPAPDLPIGAPVPGGSEAIAGGILAARVCDTLKRERGGARWSELFETDDAPLEIDTTVERDGLWHAQTPQLFRAGPLGDALRAALAARVSITDEASAMERHGKRCLLIEATAPNLKVTLPADLDLARAVLAWRAAERTG